MRSVIRWVNQAFSMTQHERSHAPNLGCVAVACHNRLVIHPRWLHLPSVSPIHEDVALHKFPNMKISFTLNCDPSDFFKYDLMEVKLHLPSHPSNDDEIFILLWKYSQSQYSWWKLRTHRKPRHAAARQRLSWSSPWVYAYGVKRGTRHCIL